MKIIIILMILIAIFAIGCASEENLPNVVQKPPSFNEEVDSELFCETAADCVPETCCHPTSCVNIENAPDCSGIACTLECKPGTMDCGAASCGCFENKCVTVTNR